MSLHINEYIVVHNIAQNSSDNLLSYPPIITARITVYSTEGSCTITDERMVNSTARYSATNQLDFGTDLDQGSFFSIFPKLRNMAF